MRLTTGIAGNPLCCLRVHCPLCRLFLFSYLVFACLFSVCLFSPFFIFVVCVVVFHLLSFCLSNSKAGSRLKSGVKALTIKSGTLIFLIVSVVSCSVFVFLFCYCSRVCVVAAAAGAVVVAVVVVVFCFS